MPWTIRVPLQPDESLSSWLARAALRQGCDPLVLTGSVWPEWRAWIVDVDRGMSADRLHALSTAAGISPTCFAQTFLRVDVEAIAGRALAGAETWPWLLALGSRNRRRHGGQQFCPACLAEDAQPYFRRQWRFAWHVTCTRHRTLLIDQCSVCGAPVAFHRLLAQDGHLALCSRCRGDFRRAGVKPASMEAMAVQSIADNVLASGAGVIWNHSAVTAKWFVTARFLVDVLRRASRRQRSRLAASIRALGIGLPEQAVPTSGLPLEMLPVVDRYILLSAVSELVQAGPEAWGDALRDSGVTVAALRGGAQCLPEPMQAMSASLSSGCSSSKRKPRRVRGAPRSETAVLGMWARLQRRSRVSEP